MSVDHINISSNISNYKVNFCETDAYLHDILGIQPAIYIIDRKVWDLYKDTSLSDLKDSEKLFLDISEDIKNLESVEKIYDEIINKSPKKNLTLISIGGGITQDITGFFASTIYRGISWIFIPTTLLAQSDSCIGSKTSLNYKSYKNLLGTFFPPKEIYINTNFIDTLDDNDFLSGLGEIAKLHLIGGAKDTESFLANIDKLLRRSKDDLLQSIKRSLQIKKEYIETDEFDAGIRNILNFGHCFGHAIESSTEFLVPHGLAVVIGILLANFVSFKRNSLTENKMKLIEHKVLNPLLRKIHLDSIIFDVERITDGMKKDKKRTGTGIPLIIMEENHGFTKINDLRTDEIIEAFKYFTDSARTKP